MTWIANLLIVVGLWLVGEKKRVAFVFSILGEGIWVVVSVRRGMYDLAAICAVFFVLAIVNWWKWGRA